jgi:hypothetical protein
MNRLMTNVTSFLALAPALMAGPRTPHGIYAMVGIAQYEENYLRTHSSVPSDYFTSSVYPELLANPDVSGITLYVHWSRLNPNPAPSGLPLPRGYSQYDWTTIQDLLDLVAGYNTANKAHKTVQLVVTPGINSPTWLLGDVGMNNGLLYSCNYLFSTAYAPPPTGTECGKVTFSGFVEGGYDKATGVASPQDLPMPWDSTYKNAWQTFLTALAKQFGSRTELVSIAVAGPTASSEEMMFPTRQNTNGAVQLNSLTPEQMWNDLLENHYTGAYKDFIKYWNSDVAIIDEWEHAIDMFGKTFSGLTLTISTGDSFPNLDAPLPTDVPCNLNKGETCTFAIPSSPIDFHGVCLANGDMDCAAETTILAYFNLSTVGGSNAKATMMDGMKGGAKHGNLGVPSVKLVSFETDLFTSPSQRILGGSQFAHRFSNDAAGAADEGGCTSGCSAEQAEYNVLVWFFDETSEGPSFPSGTVAIGGHNGPAPLNYLQIYGGDVTYASNHASNPKVAVTMGGTTKMVTAQELLHKASLALAAIAEN